MLLSELNSVENAIVVVLAEHQTLPATELHHLIVQRFRPVSPQAIYKELRKLLEQGVIWKQASEYGLSASWILNISELADTMYQSLTNEPRDQKILPADSKKHTFGFSSLARLDDFWIHLIFVFLQNSRQKQMYQWFPHPWFNLIHSHKSFPLQRALKAAGYCVKVIVGGDTFLDKRASKISTKGAYEFNYAPSTFHSEQETYYAVSDSYLFTAKLDSSKVNDIENLYNSIDSPDSLDISAIIDVVNRRCEVKASIEARTNTQRKIWNQFVDYFEVSKKSKI